MMYTVCNQCKEVPELSYEDGLKFIYFNAEGTKGGSKGIRNLLTYFEDSRDSSVTDDATREIHSYVSRVRVQPEVREEYMKFDEIIMYERLDEKKEDIIELLEEYGEISRELREKIEKEFSKTVLKKWHKLAAQVDTIEEFMDKM